VFEQEVRRPQAGQPGRIKNTYFDPKTGQPFLKTREFSRKQRETDFHTVRSVKGPQTLREIRVLGEGGRTSERYVFDYGNKRYYHRTYDAQGAPVKTDRLPKGTDYFKTVDRLSHQPPSSRAASSPGAPASKPAQAPAQAAKV
jgi:hypothetical protein